MILEAIPESLKLATAAGIGVFIAFIGLEHAGFIDIQAETLVKIRLLPHSRFCSICYAGAGL
jgi:AGZA family xanthine/uracil permease-like MFS transporter